MRGKLLKFVLVCLGMTFLLSPIVNAEVYGSISGKVYVENTGKGLEGWEVQAITGEDLESVDWLNISDRVIRENVEVKGRSTTDKNGNYYIPKLTSGKYLLVLLNTSNYDLKNFRIVNLEKGKNITNYDFNLTKLVR